MPTLVPAIAEAFDITGERAAALRAALDHKDVTAVATLPGEAGALLSQLVSAGGAAARARTALARLGLPPRAREEREQLGAVLDGLAAAMPSLKVTVDPVENRGFEYHTGISFAFFARAGGERGPLGELGRGGRYNAGDPAAPEPATGVTLYTDTILSHPAGSAARGGGFWCRRTPIWPPLPACAARGGSPLRRWRMPAIGTGRRTGSAAAMCWKARRPCACASGRKRRQGARMGNVAVVGAQWGDEGKGKIVDWLSERADVVVRFQGGHNAGHTLVIGNVEYKLSLLPSGVVRGKLSIIGNGVVVDPWALLAEIETMRGKGLDISPENLKLADNAALILPSHGALDRAREERRRRQEDRHHRARHRPGL